jgi:phosphoglycolate phosphatase
MDNGHPRLLLFDIDGTLIRLAGEGRKALNLAFQKIYGIADGFTHVEMMGRTDPLILDEVLKTHNLPPDHDRFLSFQKLYFDYLEEELERPHEDKRLCSGIMPLLDALRDRSNFVLGLLTGNWRTGAYLKLRHFGIDNRFEFGAFADDSAIRTELVSIAIDRFYQRKGIHIPPQNVYVIGDTPYDVSCAKPHGAKTIAVATGVHPITDLVDAKPDHVFTDFTDTEAVLSIF